MVNHLVRLDEVFHALADTSRRNMFERLVQSPASVSQLAEPLSMSLPAVMQHVAVLESAGLVTSLKTGRVRTVALVPGALAAPGTWIAAQRMPAERRLDRLGDLLAADTTPPEEN